MGLLLAIVIIFFLVILLIKKSTFNATRENSLSKIYKFLCSVKKLLLIFMLVAVGTSIYLISCNNNPEEIRDRGIELFEEGEFEEAIEKFDKCIKINPNDSMAYFWRGKARFGRVQTFDEDNYLDCFLDLNWAIEDFDKAISLVNDPSELYLRKGHALYVHSNKYSSYWTAGLHPEYGKERYINALLEYREECISSLTYFINKEDEQNVNIDLAYLLRGHMYYILNRYDESLKDFNNCLLIDPENSNAWSQKGFVQYFGFNSKKEACECWEKGKDFGSESAISAIDEYCSAFFDLKLVKRYNDYNRAHIVLEFKNRSDKHVDKLWLKAELRDKEGNYLAGTEYIHFTNIGKNTSFTEDASWQNINAYDIGEIVLSLNYLEIEGVLTRYFQNKYFEMIDNKYGITVHF
jgi:tetratricopeptide (TPR) repeat protein